MNSGVDFFYQAWQLGEVIYFEGSIGRCFSGVRVGGFQDRFEADFQRRFNVHVDTVSDVEDLLCRLVEAPGGDFEDS